jgi:2-isopropylmalate synthase
MENDKLIIFDTTLRDGEQSPGATLNIDEKVLIAKQLYALGVDVCEAGFPIASNGDFEAVRQIVEETNKIKQKRINGPMTICGLARCCKKDIDRAHEALKNAKKPRLHLFLATSDIHLEFKLKISREQCLLKIKEMVSYAKTLCEDIEFSPEDACRTNLDFLCQAVSVAINAGATTINIPDTVGYITPNEMYNIISYLKQNVVKFNDVIWSTHCHNDLGLATANTLSGILAGARQVEVTINGIGERAGNTSLEEIVMTLSTRPQIYPVIHSINTIEIMKTSRMVSCLTDMVVQPNKAIVGVNAFAHEAGIHQHGVLQNELTYEIMKPQSIGLQNNSIVLGKHSGRHAYKERIIKLGYTDMTDEEIKIVVKKIKDLADIKKKIKDDDIHAVIVNETLCQENEWKIISIEINSSHESKSEAHISMINKEHRCISRKSSGNGPIEAIYNCISHIIGISTKLKTYKVDSITSGFDALGRVSVKISNDNTLFSGYSTHTDIIMASAYAYINAICKINSSNT